MPQHPHRSVDDFRAETERCTDFSVVVAWSHVRKVPRRSYVSVTLIESFERKIVQITRARYQVEVQWEWEFHDEIPYRDPELTKHVVVDYETLNTRDALYGRRTKGMRIL